MAERFLGTTVIGSYSLPSWLEHACAHLEHFGRADREELVEDAVTVAIRDQLAAGLDVITDGEQTRLDFNLSFYGFLENIEVLEDRPRRFGPPAHDQRGRYRIAGELAAPKGLGAVADFRRLQRLCAALVPEGRDAPVLKASVPGPYTLAGRLAPCDRYPDRYAVTEALLPVVRSELEALVEAGCRELAVDEPSMSCYAHREDPARLTDIFNRTVGTVGERCRLSTHLCFGNYRGHAVGPRSYRPLFPAFLDLEVEEIHVEMANREFAELSLISTLAERFHVAVGIVDVKSYYIETLEDIAERTRRCLEHLAPERLSLAPDCGLSQTARWAARRKLAALVEGVRRVGRELRP